VGTVEAPTVRPSADEVADWEWVAPSALRDDVTARPHRYTAWFRLLLDPALAAAPASRDTPATENSA
jgi:isopentenyl-diphosphate delta-isomerase